MSHRDVSLIYFVPGIVSLGDLIIGHVTLFNVRHVNVSLVYIKHLYKVSKLHGHHNTELLNFQKPHMFNIYLGNISLGGVKSTFLSDFCLQFMFANIRKLKLVYNFNGFQVMAPKYRTISYGLLFYVRPQDF